MQKRMPKDLQTIRERENLHRLSSLASAEEVQEQVEDIMQR